VAGQEIGHQHQQVAGGGSQKWGHGHMMDEITARRARSRIG